MCKTITIVKKNSLLTETAFPDDVASILLTEGFEEEEYEEGRNESDESNESDNEDN